MQGQLVVRLVLGYDSPSLVDGKYQVPVGACGAVGKLPFPEDILYALLYVGLDGAWCGAAEIAAHGIKVGAGWLCCSGRFAGRLDIYLLCIIEIGIIVDVGDHLRIWPYDCESGIGVRELYGLIDHH